MEDLKKKYIKKDENDIHPITRSVTKHILKDIGGHQLWGVVHITKKDLDLKLNLLGTIEYWVDKQIRELLNMNAARKGRIEQLRLKNNNLNKQILDLMGKQSHREAI